MILYKKGDMRSIQIHSPTGQFPNMYKLFTKIS